ncbi:MAG: hypothetical protein ACYDAD_14705 [Acidimicrobiales bacterium]
MRARAFALLPVAALVLGACGGGGARTSVGQKGAASTTTSGSPGSPGASTSTTSLSSALSLTGSSPTGTGAGSGSVSGSTGSSGPGAASSTGPTGPTAPTGGGAGDAAGAARETAARKALDDYVRAVAQHDASTLGATSTGPPRALAGVLQAIAAINSSRGATTTVQTTRSVPFTVTANQASRVTLDGTIQFSFDVSGPRGHVASTSTLSGPVQVVFVDRAWKVGDFVYDGKPLLHVHENATQEVSGVVLTVAYTLSYGKATAVVVAVAARNGHVDLSLQGAKLTTTAGSDDKGTGDFTNEATPTGVVRFGRTDATPTRFEATFKRGDGTTAAFSVALTGQPDPGGGQPA